MLPWPGRPHDQLLRSTLVAGIGGLVVGHTLWLIAISVAIATSNVDRWVLVVAAVIAVLSAAAIVLGWRLYRRKSYVWAALLLCLPISPVLLTLAVLGVTYL
jgi:hypothetical protein